MPRATGQRATRAIARLPDPVWHALIALLCLAAPVCGLIYNRYNWDMLAYIGIVKSWHAPDFAAAHASTYADAEAFAQSWGLSHAYAKLVNPAQPYRLACLRDAQVFFEQLPFYRVRPVYLLLLDLVSRLTGSVAAACVFVSAFAVLATNAALARFALARCSRRAAAVLVGLLCTSPALFWAAEMCTADGLTALCVATAAIAFAGERRLLAAALLSIGVGVRSDQVVLNAVLAACLLAEGLQRQQLANSLPAVLLLGASVLAAEAISHWVGGYNYHTLYHVTFMEGFDPHPQRFAAAPIPLRHVLSAIAEGTAEGFANGSIGAVLCCCLAIAWFWQTGLLSEGETLLAVALAATFVARLALFPSPDVRLTAPIFVGLAVPLIAGAGRLRTVARSGE